MLLVSTTRIIPGRAVPSFLSGRYSAVKVRKKLYVTPLSVWSRALARRLYSASLGFTATRLRASGSFDLMQLRTTK